MILTVQNFIIMICLLVVAAGICVIGCYIAMKQQAKRLRTVDFFLPTKEKSGLAKIAFISDLHFPLFTPNSQEVIRRIADGDCDAVMIGGDLCQNIKGKALMVDFLRELSENVSVPVFVVFGNHDNSEVCKLNEAAREEYKALVEACGDNIKVLSNELESFECKGLDRVVYVGGFEDSRILNDDTVRKLSSTWKMKADSAGEELVFLTHNPDICMKLEENSCSVILSGHTHGGQVYMPFNLEFLLLRKDILPKQGYKYGYYDYKGKNKLFISCGIGCSFLPIRFRTTGEIVFVYL